MVVIQFAIEVLSESSGSLAKTLSGQIEESSFLWCPTKKRSMLNPAGAAAIDWGKLDESQIRSLLQDSLTSIPKDYGTAYTGFAKLCDILSDRIPAEVLEDLGEFLMDATPLIGQVFESEEDLKQAAYDALTRSLDLERARGTQPSCKKYFYLGQLTTGQDSYHWYHTGREILKARLHGRDEEDLVRFGDFSAAIAELYMTDLCDNDEAQDIIEQVLEEAARVVPQHFDCRVQQCAYSRIIGDLEQAREDALFALSILRPFIREVLEDTTELELTAVDMDNLPVYDSQLNLARLCVDIDMVAEGLEILNFLLRQDDADDRVWHRMALAYERKGDNAEALRCAETALGLVEDDKEDEEMQGYEEDDNRKEALTVLIEALKEKGKQP
eukprot:Blabericola_migrator_1__810@NODE_11_length_24785_cov_110_100736_g8_i0_p11_GENE_NODE_11_length_24785_cov_110_100736_g8_i0NODE_11_length_24785_cov_110_100736_g8_i0_p11_ORF_typecomplete_len385_score76_05TPR_15/PF13429_6/4_9e03TPR_15/PF13429_6/89TPR_15/PF13429_6/4_2e06TPR_8/PF13181_6/3_6e03TPR_8/PF13181_6/5_5e02TPR_8/PF13181_6/50TPR_8/PF13181_6/0_0017TPR_19/PF14559_6/82TPR_19/PF14559_6/7_7e03TPR_19/PF14559_6/4_7TPR_19/PF14559_6/0_0014TPR_19/PF14559_6/1_6e03TPR_12/PF13424_6/1_2e03TPR_12/PF13424_6/2_7